MYLKLHYFCSTTEIKSREYEKSHQDNNSHRAKVQQFEAESGGNSWVLKNPFTSYFIETLHGRQFQ